MDFRFARTDPGARLYAGRQLHPGGFDRRKRRVLFLYGGPPPKQPSRAEPGLALARLFNRGFPRELAQSFASGFQPG